MLDPKPQLGATGINKSNTLLYFTIGETIRDTGFSHAEGTAGQSFHLKEIKKVKNYVLHFLKEQNSKANHKR